MNFGGGPNGNGFQNPNFTPFSQSTQLPFPSMPMFAMPSVHPMHPMQSMHPSMMPPVQTTYPPGQGPLADRPVQRGANGLYQAPEPDAPEQHPASQHIALNPGELAKYMEYWAQACDGAETVGGSDAVAFLSRASNVSKGQLRTIWDIADHRKEAKLDQNQFFIALRLIALAQRGAALSEAGLRNFRGIQLIPDIAPPPPPVKQQPTEQQSSHNAASHKQPNAFSWTVPKHIVSRYDSFFHQLDDRKLGSIDGKQGVTFFGKSGLPRSTLKVIWQLADVTRDGKLSLDEFRTAMHMVANIRNRKLSVETLPTVLDPTGPNWFRIEGEQQLQQPSPIAPNPVHSHASPTPQIPVIPQLSPTAHTVQQPGHRRQPSSSGSRTPRAAPRSSAISPQPHLGSNISPQPVIVPHPPQQAIVPPPPPPSAVQQHDAAQEQMREALRKERQEVERARREMEEMRAEMEKLRLEKEALAKTSSAHSSKAKRTPSHSRQPSASSIPLPSQHSGFGASRKPAAQPVPDLLSGSHPAASTARSPVKTPERSSNSYKPSPAMHARNVAAVGQISPVKPLKTPDRNKPIDLGLDDDDIWDQPSPKSSALPGPPKVPNMAGTIQSKDSVSSDDDDDDFWGAVGMGKKPTLGPPGGDASAAASGTGKGFGGSELDDWAF